LAGAGEVEEAPTEVFEGALERCRGVGGYIWAFGHERLQQTQEQRGEQIGGGAGGWREHERNKNIVGRRWQGGFCVEVAGGGWSGGFGGRWLLIAQKAALCTKLVIRDSEARS